MDVGLHVCCFDAQGRVCIQNNYENYGIGVDIRRGDSCLESVRIGLLSIVRTALYSVGLAVLLGLWFFSGNHSQRIEARQEI